ncbi:NYN domain protein, partial [Glutamicibacter nicotianae]
VSGDDDLAEAVEEAQDLGMKVVLLGVAKSDSRLGVASVAEHLALTADYIETVPNQLLDSAFTKVLEWDKNHSEKTSLIASASTETEPKPVAKPVVPTPAVMAQKLVAKSKMERDTEPEVVYSSGGLSSGYQGSAAYEQKELKVAEEIGAKVAESWLAFTTQHDVVELIADKPQLPPEIDRTLLKDCAQVLGEWKTDQQTIRRTLRGAFWEYLDRIM